MTIFNWFCYDHREPFIFIPESNSPYMTEDNGEIPSYVPYLLIGAGTASHSAMRAIRLKDHKAQVCKIQRNAVVIKVSMMFWSCSHIL